MLFLEIYLPAKLSSNPDQVCRSPGTGLGSPGIQFEEIKKCVAKPRVLSPSGSTFCAILSASVVAMSILQGTTTKMIVSLFATYFSIKDFI